MKKDTYLDELKSRYERQFDVATKYKFKGENFDIYAKYNVINSRYFISKEKEIDRFDVNEFCFVKYISKLCIRDIEGYVETLKKELEEIVTIDKNHMNSNISFIVITDKVEDENIVKTVEKFKYQKSFMFGLRGWVDINLGVVSLSDDEVYLSKKLKDNKKFYTIGNNTNA